MKFSLTIFKSIYDNKTNARMDFNSFDSFSKLLFTLSKKKYKDKKSASLISPATYLEGTTRKNMNVVDWGGWAALDIDTGFENIDIEKELPKKFPKYDFICYSTASSTREQPKFRMIFELNQRVGVDKISQFWHALNTEFGKLSDTQVKDMSRMYYIPGNYSSASYQFIFKHQANRIIDVDELIEKHPTPKPKPNNFFDNLPEQVQKQIIEYKKNKLDNDVVKWTSYKNCRFWPKRLAKEYLMISDTGWYHKMFQIMISIASKATKAKYPITPEQIEQLCREFDNETGGWYRKRPMKREAERALEYVYRNVL